LKFEIRNEDIDIVSSKVYSTKNTPLAAYLFAKGFEYLGTDKSDIHNVVFKFSNSDKAMSEAIVDFELGKAPESRFYLAYKKLVREVRS